MHGSVQYTISDLAVQSISRPTVYGTLLRFAQLNVSLLVGITLACSHEGSARASAIMHSFRLPSVSLSGRDPLGQVIPKCAEGEYAQAPGATPHSLVRLDRCVRSLP